MDREKERETRKTRKGAVVSFLSLPRCLSLSPFNPGLLSPPLLSSLRNESQTRALGGKADAKAEKLPPAPVRSADGKKETKEAAAAATRLVRPPTHSASPPTSPHSFSSSAPGPPSRLLVSALIGGAALLVAVAAWANRRKR
jgi:hypothetical protein